MNESLLQEIRDLAAKHAERDVSTITSQTRLREDLRLDHNEAESFINAFAERFDVDVSGLVWLRYFHDESVNPLMRYILRERLRDPAFAQHWRAAEAQERSIDIAHLVGVAEAKRWLHPAPDKRPPPYEPTRTAKVLNLIGVAIPVLLTLAAIALCIYATVGGGLSTAYAGLYAVTLGLIFLQWRAWRLAERQIAAKLESANSTPPSPSAP